MPLRGRGGLRERVGDDERDAGGDEQCASSRMSIVRRWATSAASIPSAKYGSIAASVLENVMLSPWPAIDQL